MKQHNNNNNDHRSICRDVHGEHIVKLMRSYWVVFFSVPFALQVQVFLQRTASLRVLRFFSLSLSIHSLSLSPACSFALDRACFFFGVIFFPSVVGRLRRHLYNFDFGKRPVGADIVWLSTIFFGFVLQSRYVYVVEIVVHCNFNRTYADRHTHSPPPTTTTANSTRIAAAAACACRTGARDKAEW